MFPLLKVSALYYKKEDSLKQALSNILVSIDPKVCTMYSYLSIWIREIVKKPFFFYMSQYFLHKIMHFLSKAPLVGQRPHRVTSGENYEQGGRKREAAVRLNQKKFSPISIGSDDLEARNKSKNDKCFCLLVKILMYERGFRRFEIGM